MQSEHIKWKKQIKGNRQLQTVLNPLRNYIEKQIKTIDLTKFPQRPQLKIDLSIGDPTLSKQFRTHPSNIQIIANNVGKVDGYTNFQGIDDSRQALVDKFCTQNYEITKQNVFLTAGGSMAIWISALLLAQQGDNFLFPSPGFPLLLTIAKSRNIIPKFYHLQSDKNWEADLNQLQSLIDQRTKFVYVNDPSNPLGSCWSQQHKSQIIQICRKFNLPIIADQIYEGVTYNKSTKTFSQVSNGEVTIFKCSGLTKRYFGPGWRLGWLILYGKKGKIQNYLKGLHNICNIVLMANTVMQCSLKQIINNQLAQNVFKQKLDLMKKNEQMINSTLKKTQYCEIVAAKGALYSTIILKLQKFDNKKINGCIDFCKQLYAEQNMMIFPGEFFASSLPFVRLTISCSNSIIQEFLKRFTRFCQKKLA